MCCLHSIFACINIFKLSTVLYLILQETTTTLVELRRFDTGGKCMLIKLFSSINFACFSGERIVGLNNAERSVGNERIAVHVDIHSTTWCYFNDLYFSACATGKSLCIECLTLHSARKYSFNETSKWFTHCYSHRQERERERNDPSDISNHNSVRTQCELRNWRNLLEHS